jgi:hypothetical protein
MLYACWSWKDMKLLWMRLLLWYRKLLPVVNIGNGENIMKKATYQLRFICSGCRIYDRSSASSQMFLQLILAVSLQILYRNVRTVFRWFLAYFPYFEKIKIGLWDHVAVCVCVCARVCVFPLLLLGNGSVKVPLSLLGNGSVKIPLSFARQRLGKNPLIVC